MHVLRSIPTEIAYTHTNGCYEKTCIYSKLASACTFMVVSDPLQYRTSMQNKSSAAYNLVMLLLPYCYTQSSNIHCLCLKVAGPVEQPPPQSDSEHDNLSSPCSRPLHATCVPEVPAAHPLSMCAGVVRTPSPSPTTASPRSPPMLPRVGVASIPLQLTQQQGSIFKFDIGAVVPILSACIDLSVAIIQVHIAAEEAAKTKLHAGK